MFRALRPLKRAWCSRDGCLHFNIEMPAKHAAKAAGWIYNDAARGKLHA
jgi:hypothetical protein